jgi:serine/threonine protein kinase/formylglycine-generating enzyme required for sulfatase activity
MQVVCPWCRVQVEVAPSTDTVRDCPACGRPMTPQRRPGPEEETVTEPTAAVPAGSDASIPRQLGRYRVTERLGSGSFGSVYKGHDDDLRRAVAIKVPHPQRLASAQDAEAYLNEARVLAHLDHPAIVPVYDVGRTGDGVCYVVSKFIEGSDLATRLHDSRPAAADSARLVLRLAEALQHAHQQGIVHRDIKPGNILLDRCGLPYLSDFGLALREEDFARGPRFAGTPAYMSPEQARSEGHRVDGRTDIYSLGAVFYELLTGRRPFEGENLAELLEQITTREPQPPRHLDGSIPPELDRICLKCLAKRAADRYATPAELAEDLRACLGQLQIAGQNTPSSQSAISNLQSAIKVVPKGLRAFDAQDSDFFLELLPGPRDREGLPASIRFWKTRVESTDPAATFQVGLIYGPSGCGKSSLVRAGLVPRLAPQVAVIQAEAGREGTEMRVLLALHRVCPDLKEELDLAAAVAAVRRGSALSSGRKLLVIVDQFEQWLHAQADRLASSPLVAALRQADGGRVQFLLLVRDDFWLAASRLFQELEIPLVEGQNVELIDLFEPRHARRVLQLFGQAHDCLPADDSAISYEQHVFLDQAVADLSENGKVISVRLSLFAEMMKGRPWTPAALRAVGGAQGLGVTFLQDAFSLRSASPEYHAYEKEARAVLGVLLPEAGSAIKGQVRSHAELLNASGMHAQPRRFERLLAILDRELRIITPTSPLGEPAKLARSASEGNHTQARSAGEGTPQACDPGPRLYQLTHDFLVPALREWLTQKKRETWRGRAELTLEMRAAQWARSRQDRFLPSPLEYLHISVAVPWGKRKPEEQALMYAATMHYGVVAVALFLAVCCGGWLAWEVNGRNQARRLVETIAYAEPQELGRLIREELPRYRRWANPMLYQQVNAPDDEQHLRASLALLDVDAGQIPYLAGRLLDCPLPDFAVVRDSLRPHAAGLLDDLWRTLRDSKRKAGQRFHAGLALAAYASDQDTWTAGDAVFLVDQLLHARGDDQRDLRQDLRPIAERLLAALQSAFRDAKERLLVRVAAAEALADFVPDRPALLAELASGAEPEQYDVLLPLLTQAPQEGRAAARDRLLSLVAEEPAGESGEQQRVELGRRRAGAAITLLHLEQRDGAGAVFRVHGDPEALTQFVHRVKDRHLGPAPLAECLRRQRQPLVRFALLLALGEYRLDELPEKTRPEVKEQLLAWYRQEPSSAIHGACGWLLRTWGFHQEAAAVERTPLAYDPTGEREWFVQAVGGEHFTFVVFGPGEFVMGSPPSEGYRQKNEGQHRVRLTRRFAIADRELTHGQFRRFLDGIRLPFVDIGEASPSPEHPLVQATWSEAVYYCWWLTKQAGRDDQQCYEAPSEGLGQGNLPRNWPCRPERRGFRLPTEAEWEYACRAGTTTTYSFGSDRDLLKYYGWHLHKGTEVGGRLRPNLRGLFDMHGNAWEWCQDWYQSQLQDADDPMGPDDGKNRTLRGGGYDRSAWHCRSAYRHSPTPDYRGPYMGFRLVQTLP